MLTEGFIEGCRDGSADKDGPVVFDGDSDGKLVGQMETLGFSEGALDGYNEGVADGWLLGASLGLLLGADE